MATYLELYGIRDDSELLNRTKVAVIIAAHGISEEATPVAERLAWATDALADPATAARQALWFMLAANQGLSVATIQAATDGSLQTQVELAVNLISGAEPA